MKKATISFKEKLAIVEYLRANTEELNGMNYPEIGTKIFEATGSRITQGMIAGIIRDAEIKILIKQVSRSSPTRTSLISLTMQHNDLVDRHEMLTVGLAETVDLLRAQIKHQSERHEKLNIKYDLLADSVDFLRVQNKGILDDVEELRRLVLPPD